MYYPVSNPNESQWRRIDIDLLTTGYLWKRVRISKRRLRATAKGIIVLCQKFVRPTVFYPEAIDPVNRITLTDERLCDQYKEEGNGYFKSKNYGQAIIKYTTAIRYNPNNHLLYSNRSYCHYLMANYDDARTDILFCIEIKPTFCKGWFRYGLVLEKLRNYEKAGVAYKTAVQLSQYQSKDQNSDEKSRKSIADLCQYRYLC